jgi:hypothetical protein
MADSSTPKDEDEQHRKFREALERKKKAAHGNPEHAQAAQGVREAHNDHQRREFRRKAGS